MILEHDSQRPAQPAYHMAETDVDVGAIDWALRKLSAYEMANNTPDTAMMMDRLKAMLGS